VSKIKYSVTAYSPVTATRKGTVPQIHLCTQTSFLYLYNLWKLFPSTWEVLIFPTPAPPNPPNLPLPGSTGVWTQGFALSRPSTTWALPRALLALVILEIGYCLFPRSPDLPYFKLLCCLWDDRQVLPCPAFFQLRWSCELFAQAGFKPQSSWSLSLK
jgi:hypothetical protein